MSDHLRTWKNGPFTLELYDSGESDSMGKSVLTYQFYHDDGDGNATEIFHGSDFAASPMHAIDSDETVGALLGFLALQDGDTDSEYFANYTPEQIEWRDNHAEELSMYVYELEESGDDDDDY